MALQNLPQVGILGWKKTIWQPCLSGIVSASNGEETESFFKKSGCPGWGANPGPLKLIYFIIFHHFTADPQRLPRGQFF
jgi:hypothetical protein